LFVFNGGWFLRLNCKIFRQKTASADILMINLFGISNLQLFFENVIPPDKAFRGFGKNELGTCY
jgi:hypothetical protein